MLNACCVSETCLENLDVAVEECLSANSYVDAMVCVFLIRDKQHQISQGDNCDKFYLPTL